MLTPLAEAQGKGACVRMAAAPMHRVDAAIINGTALGKLKKNAAASMAKFPRVGGCEGFGVVETVTGPELRVAPNDTVWVAPSTFGTWATRTMVPAHLLHRVPQSIVAAHKISAPLLSCMTCLLLAHRLVGGFSELSEGDLVVQNGGSSLVSLAVTALAKRKGCRVITAATPGARFAAATERQTKMGSEE